MALLTNKLSISLAHEEFDARYDVFEVTKEGRPSFLVVARFRGVWRPVYPFDSRPRRGGLVLYPCPKRPCVGEGAPRSFREKLQRCYRG